LQQGKRAEQIDAIGRLDIVVRDKRERCQMNDPIRPRELHCACHGSRIEEIRVHLARACGQRLGHANHAVAIRAEAVDEVAPGKAPRAGNEHALRTRRHARPTAH